jgi:hypothetical protein
MSQYEEDEGMDTEPEAWGRLSRLVDRMDSANPDVMTWMVRALFFVFWLAAMAACAVSKTLPWWVIIGLGLVFMGAAVIVQAMDQSTRTRVRAQEIRTDAYDRLVGSVGNLEDAVQRMTNDFHAGQHEMATAVTSLTDILREVVATVDPDVKVPPMQVVGPVKVNSAGRPVSEGLIRQTERVIIDP